MQRARQLRILKAAARLADDNGLDRVQMQEVARSAEVAIGTLYRYFPSKTHLFTAVMAEQIERFGQQLPEPCAYASPAEAVFEVLVSAMRNLLRRPALAHAMIRSTNAAHAPTVNDAERVETGFRSIMLRAWGVEDPTEQQLRRVRLLALLWYSILQSRLNNRASVTDTETDLRLACALLLTPGPAAAEGRTD